MNFRRPLCTTSSVQRGYLCTSTGLGLGLHGSGLCAYPGAPCSAYFRSGQALFHHTNLNHPKFPNTAPQVPQHHHHPATTKARDQKIGCAIVVLDDMVAKAQVWRERPHCFGRPSGHRKSSGEHQVLSTDLVCVAVVTCMRRKFSINTQIMAVSPRNKLSAAKIRATSKIVQYLNRGFTAGLNCEGHDACACFI